MMRVLIVFLLFLSTSAFAQYDFLIANRNAVADSYDFWVYTPEDYYYSQEQTPLVVFLHGASLCGRDLNRSRRYGPLDAIVRGRDIPALVIVPQNPGGAWNPRKIAAILDWARDHYPYDTTRVYVLGMSLGGYGTMDFCAAYPERVAAGMALCGGCSQRNPQGLGQLPFWILHGTADKAVDIGESKKVVEALKREHNDRRLRYDWLKGASHGALARIFYMEKTYEWLFSHSLADPDRPVRRDITIGTADLKGAYGSRRSADMNPEVIDD